MAKLSKSEFGKLREAVRHSRRKLLPFRDSRVRAIKQFVGKHYSDNGAPDKVAVPLLAMTIKIYLRHLVARDPAVLMLTQNRDLKPSAFRFERDVNHLLQEIELGNTLELLALDALFSVGVYKIARGPLMADGTLEGDYYAMRAPYVAAIELDDAVWDMSGTRFPGAFVGNRYRRPLAAVKADKSLKHTADLKPTLKGATDDVGGERAEGITRGGYGAEDEFEDHIDLWDMYLPRRGLLLTYPFEGEGPLLRQTRWSGPKRGPYGMLSYGEVPGQVNPLPPVALWIDLHELVNALFRKLGRQAERQKEITAYSAGAAADAQREQEARDGDMVQMQQPERVTPVRTGGIDPRNLAFFINCRDIYSWVAGNLDALGGLSAQAETLGQERMMGARSSKTVEELQQRTIRCARDIVRDLAWYRWYDPLAERQSYERLPGSDVEVPILFSPDTRDGDFLDYNIQIEPYSMQYQPPAERLEMIRRIWREDVIPMMPLLTAQGMGANVEAYLRMVSKYSNLPELEDLIEFVGPSPAEAAGGAGERARQSPVTTRENVRVNRSAGTRPGTDKVLQEILLGGGAQQAEMSAALGPK